MSTADTAARVTVARELHRVLLDLAGMIDPDIHDYAQSHCEPFREWREYAKQFAATVEEGIGHMESDGVA